MTTPYDPEIPTQTKIIATIIRDGLQWEAIESLSGRRVDHQPSQTLENLLLCHKSGICVRVVEPPVEQIPAGLFGDNAALTGS